MAALLTRSKFFAAKGIQAAIIASPIFLAVAPSHAGGLIISRTFNGFTDAFAQANWGTQSTNSGGTITFTPTTLQLVRPVASGSTPVVKYLVAASFLENPQNKPIGNPGAVKFLYGVYSYDWSITSGTSNNGGLAAYNFSQTETGKTSVELAFPATPPQTPVGTASGSGANLASQLVDNTEFGWFLSKTNNTGSPSNTNATATISNFVFTATYETVPGPLPLAGAAAAFAWSRRLRRRLKTAQTSI